MEILIRATVIYWFMWLVMRGTGKRSLAELTPLEMIMIVVLGDFVQQAVTQEDMSITGAALAVSVFVGWTLISDAVARRSPSFAGVVRGEPVVVLRRGEPLDRRLAEERLSLEDLKEAARLQGYGDLAQLEYGILETDGEFSFIAKQK
ncbi:MAG TPA: YetF domain-containing protein [Acidimicrobiia bacterium]|nr:YetF domain-containing protein [Acidimicrobiia bacterium]